MIGFMNSPQYQIARALIDSGPIVCLAAGGYTTLIAAGVTPRKSKWIQCRLTQTAGNGIIEIALGDAGLEVDILHWAYDAGTNWDVGNLAFELPAGARISADVTANTTVEFHFYY